MKFSKYFSIAREYLNTPTKVLVLISMILWSGFLQFLLRIYPVERVARWITQSYWKPKISTNEVTRYLYWLQQMRLISNQGDCLALSMLYYRFLAMIGEEPTLLIGINDDKGHAWVELSGEVVSEPANNSKNFKVFLCLPPGGSRLSPVK